MLLNEKPVGRREVPLNNLQAQTCPEIAYQQCNATKTGPGNSATTEP